MENYLSRGITFEYRPCTTSAQFFQDLDGISLTGDDRAKHLEDYVQRRRSTREFESPNCSQKSPSSVESMLVANNDPKKWLHNYLRHLAP